MVEIDTQQKSEKINEEGLDLDKTEEMLSKISSELDQHLKGEKKRRYARFSIAALGSIPWIGGFLSASAAMNAEKEQSRINEFYRQWIEEHRQKILKLGETIVEILDRLEGFGDDVQNRIESPEYLALVRKGFRTWDQADTDEKRKLIQQLLCNACATKLCPDDLVRLFLDWIDRYHEAHFRVIKEVYQHPGVTRVQIWDRTPGPRPREDSAEADIYKLLIRDLSMGSVIRQHREKDAYRNYIKKSGHGQSKYSSDIMKSAFDDTEQYELTELGKQFVHYTMNEVVPRIQGQEDSKANK